MRQVPGQLIDVPVITAVPVANEGADMTLFFSASKVWKYALYATLTGGTSCELWLYVRRASDNTWYQLADAGGLGRLGNAVLATDASYVFQIQNIGIFDEIVIRKQNDTGGVAVVCKLQEYVENNFIRGD